VLSNRQEWRWTDVRTDDFTRNDKLHAAVLFAADGGVVRRRWLGFSEASGRNRIRRNPRLGQVVAHGRGAMLGEHLILVV
jgi:hypothetical protein